MNYYKIKTKNKIFIDDVNHFKTDDMILFKAYNNNNSIFHGSYFGHAGIIYMIDNIPYMFEANGIERVPLKDHHPKNGIFLTPVADRIKKYKGRTFLKSLKYPVSKETEKDFFEFIKFCMENLNYEYDVISNAFKKLLGFKKCDFKTDCGQIVFLSMIKLGLLDISEYDVPRLNHLKYISEQYQLINNKYEELIEIIDHPFSY